MTNDQRDAEERLDSAVQTCLDRGLSAQWVAENVQEYLLANADAT